LASESPLEEILGVRFRRPALLRRALVHRSYLNERPEPGLESNERLEFLGDSVIGYVVAQRLFNDCPTCTEGDLTERRGFLVRRDSLARFARNLNLGDYLLLGRGEDGAGGRNRAANLAGLFEAVVGAIAIDRGMTAARRFILDVMAAEITALDGQPTPIDPKSRLQEVVQARWQRAPSYRTVREEGPEHSKTFTVEVGVQARVLGAGVGPSKQEAEREAARKALDLMAAETETVSEV
jgi:ribonuclease-3